MADTEEKSPAEEAEVKAPEKVYFYDSAGSYWPDEPLDKLWVMLYGDGRYASPQHEAADFHEARWITVLGSSNCGAADFEPGNAVYSDRLRSWAEARRAGGYRARVYTDLSNLPWAWDLCAGLKNVVWWIATLDGTERTAEELVEFIKVEHKINVPITTKEIWGLQFEGGPNSAYDKSVLLGTW